MVRLIQGVRSIQGRGVLAQAIRGVKIESLEQRRLLCMDQHIPEAENPRFQPSTVIDTVEEIEAFQSTMRATSPTPPVVHQAEQFASRSTDARDGRVDSSATGSLSSSSESTAEVAPIVWVNRGITSGADDDRFDDVFGVNAGTARAVMDAAINMWARVIGSFNYAFPLGGSSYQLTVKMATGASGNGASAGVSSWFGGKPVAGGITMGSGGNGLGSGWFIDPTPFDHSEFRGTIRNAFAADAQAGSPAAGLGDFLTVALAEIAHCMGLFFSPSLFQNNVTNTGVDDAAVGGTSVLYTHSTANVQHLMTEFDSGGGDTNSAVHTAEPQNATIGGQTWSGTDDAGNAFYEFSRRYLVPENLRLIFNDSLGYSTQPAASFGNFHSHLRSNGELYIRGGEGTSDDVITVFMSGSNLIVDVDVGADVAGSGSLRGPGNLPAWRGVFPEASVSSIRIEAGAGFDIIRIDNNSGEPTTIDPGDGDDFIDFGFGTQNLDFASGPTTVLGSNGTDSIFIYDDNNTFPDTYTVTSSTVERNFWPGFSYGAAIENIYLRTGSGANTVNVSSTDADDFVRIDSWGGADVVNVGSVSNGLQSINGTLRVENLGGFSTLNLNANADVIGRNGTIFNSGTLGRLSGMSGANIEWVRDRMAGVGLTTGTGNDNVRVQSNSVPLTINSAGGVENVAIGDGRFLFGVGMNNLTGNITIENSISSATQLTLDDFYGSTNRTVTFNVNGSYSEISGLMASGLISFRNTATNGVTVSGSNSNNDTYNILTTGEFIDINTYGGDDTINVQDTGAFLLFTYSVTVQTGLGVDALNVNPDNSGTTTVNLSASDDLNSLNIGIGGRLNLNSGADKVLAVNGASISGVLNLNDNAFIRRGIASELFYRTRLANGYAGGNWNGVEPSINSSIASAATVPEDALGYGIGGQIGISTIFGVPINAGDTVIRYTLAGDADLNGSVGFSDLVELSRNYGIVQSPARWLNGDFNYDGTTGFADLVILSRNYGLALGELPRPGTGMIPRSDLAQAFSQQRIGASASVGRSVLGGVVTGTARRTTGSTLGSNADDALFA